MRVLRRISTAGTVVLSASLIGLGGVPSAAAQPVTSGATRPSAVTGRPERPTVSPAASGTRADQLASRLTSALGSTGDEVSVAVHDRRTGAVFVHNGALQNCTASVVKPLVLVTLMRERRDAGRGLSESDRALAADMIQHSDNDATTQLLARAGGGAALDRTARALGMTHTHSAASWGRTVTTAQDQLKLVDALLDGVPGITAADRGFALRLMGSVEDEQRWGVGTVPEGTRAQVKNGWAPLEPRGWRVNSIGHVTGRGRDYTMAMLSYDNASEGAGIARLDRVSGLVYDALGTAPSGTATGWRPAGPGEPRRRPDWLVRPGDPFPPRPTW